MGSLEKYSPIILGGIAAVALYILGGLMTWIAPLAVLGGAGWCLYKVVQAQKPDGPLWKAYEQVKSSTAFLWKRDDKKPPQ